MKNVNRLDAKLIAATAVGASAMVGGVAQAQIVYSGVVNLSVPRTTAGLYLNVVSGVNNTVPASAPGWDVNFWWTGTALGFFNPAGAFPAGSGTGTGAYVGASTVAGTTSNLALNSPIGTGQSYTSGANLPAWPLGQTGIVGFRFWNGTPAAPGSTVHYGWARITNYAAGSGNATIVDYAFNATPLAPIGAGEIPAPGSLALLALGAAGLTSRRRK